MNQCCFFDDSKQNPDTVLNSYLTNYQKIKIIKPQKKDEINDLVKNQVVKCLWKVESGMKVLIFMVMQRLQVLSELQGYAVKLLSAVKAPNSVSTQEISVTLLTFQKKLKELKKRITLLQQTMGYRQNWQDNLKEKQVFRGVIQKQYESFYQYSCNIRNLLQIDEVDEISIQTKYSLEENKKFTSFVNAFVDHFLPSSFNQLIQAVYTWVEDLQKMNQKQRIFVLNVFISFEDCINAMESYFQGNSQTLLIKKQSQELRLSAQMVQLENSDIVNSLAMINSNTLNYSQNMQIHEKCQNRINQNFQKIQLIIKGYEQLLPNAQNKVPYQLSFQNIPNPFNLDQHLHETDDYYQYSVLLYKDQIFGQSQELSIFLNDCIFEVRAIELFTLKLLDVTNKDTKNQESLKEMQDFANQCLENELFQRYFSAFKQIEYVSEPIKRIIICQPKNILSQQDNEMENNQQEIQNSNYQSEIIPNVEENQEQIQKINELAISYLKNELFSKYFSENPQIEQKSEEQKIQEFVNQYLRNELFKKYFT